VCGQRGKLHLWSPPRSGERRSLMAKASSLAPSFSPVFGTFSAGRLGVETAPVWRSGGRSIGCRVVGFLQSEDGSVGQAERSGLVHPGNAFAEVDGKDVRNMSYDKVLALLYQSSRKELWECAFLPTTFPSTDEGDHSTAASSPNPAPTTGSVTSTGRLPDSSPGAEEPTAVGLEATRGLRVLTGVGWAMSMMGFRRENGGVATHASVVGADGIDAVLSRPCTDGLESPGEESAIKQGRESSSLDGGDTYAPSSLSPALGTTPSPANSLPAEPEDLFEEPAVTGRHTPEALSVVAPGPVAVVDPSGAVAVSDPEGNAGRMMSWGSVGSSLPCAGEGGGQVEEVTKDPKPGRDPHRFPFFGGGGGRNSAAEESLDTVSLLSEAGPGRFGGGSSANNASGILHGDPVDAWEERERRLSRSLAVKLKERVMHCEELEDLCALRDDQVSMLQRQSNALGGRVSELEEELADHTALSAALQLDRRCLQEELDALLSSKANPPDPDSSSRAVPGCSHEGGATERLESDPHGQGLGARILDPRLDSGHPGGMRQLGVDGAAQSWRAPALGAPGDVVALGDMVRSLVAEKAARVEEVAARREESAKLRQRVRELEAVVVEAGGTPVDGDGPIMGLRRLLQERTEELEAERQEAERLASRVHEMEGEVSRLQVSLRARENDLQASDDALQELESRLQWEIQHRDASQEGLKAQVEELAAAVRGGNGAGNDMAGLILEKASWVRERSCLLQELETLRQTGDGSLPAHGRYPTMMPMLPRCPSAISPDMLLLEARLASAEDEAARLRLEMAPPQGEGGNLGAGLVCKAVAGQAETPCGGQEEGPGATVEDSDREGGCRNSSTGMAVAAAGSRGGDGNDGGDRDAFFRVGACLTTDKALSGVVADRSFVGELEKDILLDDLKKEVAQLRLALEGQGSATCGGDRTGGVGRCGGEGGGDSEGGGGARP
ncbi:unnamed protein product, partial [Discosporangium mesarthrocarpum]